MAIVIVHDDPLIVTKRFDFVTLTHQPRIGIAHETRQHGNPCSGQCQIEQCRRPANRHHDLITMVFMRPAQVGGNGVFFRHRQPPV
ncbi:hypothetical protein D3C87_2010710 [compost metagenome]